MENEGRELLITDVQMEHAEIEANAQAKIIGELRRVTPDRRAVVLANVSLLIEADRKVPGTFELLTRRRRRTDQGDDSNG